MTMGGNIAENQTTNIDKRLEKNHSKGIGVRQSEYSKKVRKENLCNI